MVRKVWFPTGQVTALKKMSTCDSPKRTDGTTIAVLAGSGNPRQTTHIVKITFINFDFLK